MYKEYNIRLNICTIVCRLIEHYVYCYVFQFRSEKPSDVESTIGESHLLWFHSLSMFVFTVDYWLIQKHEKFITAEISQFIVK